MVDASATLPAQIQRLLSDRTMHTAAVASIDQTLARISAALGNMAATEGAARSSQVGPKKPDSLKAAGSTGVKPARKRKGGAFAMTANEFILDFVRSKKTAISQEINIAWKESGRKRTADITLSLLTKAGKLKRTPLGTGIRGSRYSILV